MKTNQIPRSGYTAPAIHKATAILRVVAKEKKGIGVSGLAKQLGYGKSTVFGLTQALLSEGLLRQEPEGKLYFLGSSLFELAIMDWNHIKVYFDVQPFLEKLRDSIQETVCLGAISRDRALIMATAETTRGLRISASAGSTVPLLPGAIGKAFLSGLEPDRAREIIDELGLKLHTRNSIIDPEQYMDAVTIAGELGYAIDNEEYIEGVRAVAVGLNNTKGLPLAIWAVGFTRSMKLSLMSEMAGEITRVSRQIREQLHDWL